MKITKIYNTDLYLKPLKKTVVYNIQFLDTEVQYIISTGFGYGEICGFRELRKEVRSCEAKLSVYTSDNMIDSLDVTLTMNDGMKLNLYGRGCDGNIWLWVGGLVISSDIGSTNNQGLNSFFNKIEQVCMKVANIKQDIKDNE